MGGLNVNDVNKNIDKMESAANKGGGDGAAKASSQARQLKKWFTKMFTPKYTSIK
jgi:hypothetical protein